jgi:hypothetical protein
MTPSGYTAGDLEHAVDVFSNKMIAATFLDDRENAAGARISDNNPPMQHEGKREVGSPGPLIPPSKRPRREEKKQQPAIPQHPDNNASEVFPPLDPEQRRNTHGSIQS